MATIADLTTAVGSLTTAVDALVVAYEALKANPANSLTPADQAALDAAVAGLTTESDKAKNA